MNVGCPYRLNPHLAPPPVERPRLQPAVVWDVVCKHLDTTPYEVVEKSAKSGKINQRRESVEARSIIAYVLYERCEYSHLETADALGMRHPTTYEATKRIGLRMRQDPEYRRTIERLMQQMEAA